MKKRFILSLAAITLVAVVTSLSWGIWAMLATPQGIHPSSWTEVDLIRDRFPHYLVDPSRVVAPPDDVVIPWMIAETKTRLTLIWACWFAVLIPAFVWSRRTR